MRVGVFQFLLVGVAAYAWSRGGPTERQVASTFVIAYLATLAVNAIAADNYESPQWLLFALDGVVLIALAVVALRSRRGWTVWMVAFQLMALLGHTARLLTPFVMNWIYYLLTALLGYPMLALLAWATWRSGRPRETKAAEMRWPASWWRWPPKTD